MRNENPNHQRSQWHIFLAKHTEGKFEAEKLENAFKKQDRITKKEQDS